MVGTFWVGTRIVFIDASASAHEPWSVGPKPNSDRLDLEGTSAKIFDVLAWRSRLRKAEKMPLRRAKAAELQTHHGSPRLQTQPRMNSGSGTAPRTGFPRASVGRHCV